MTRRSRKSVFSTVVVASIFIHIAFIASAPTPGNAQEVSAPTPANVSSSQDDNDLPDDPGASRFPVATPQPSEAGDRVVMESDTQTRRGNLYTLDGNAVLTSREYIVHADHVEYNAETGDVTAQGHMRLNGPHDETVLASHGVFNPRLKTGQFFEVTGSVGVHHVIGSKKPKQAIYTVSNPFVFAGRQVNKLGEQNYEILDGWLTSCLLPHPDWRFAAARFRVRNGVASANGSVFSLLGIPLLYLPVVTHPVDSEVHTSGLMIPYVAESSTKGFVIGEEFYLALGRSMDLTVGAQYFSLRGWEQSATFRYKGAGLDFATAHYSGLLDRGFIPAGATAATANTLPGCEPNGTLCNQGGEDFAITGRKRLDEHQHAAVNAEYLSSYVYREAFTDNFNQAVFSDINSDAYDSYTNGGYAAGLRFARYQGLKNVATNQQVRIYHLPSLDFDTMEQTIGSSRLVWSSQNSATTLKRVQSNFTSDVSGRLDFHPVIGLPLDAGQWHLRPFGGLRETFYTHSRADALFTGAPPVEVSSSLNRTAFEGGVEIRPPVFERTFDTGILSNLLGHSVKHTIEPAINYLYRSGINDFNKTLRFDATDVVSNTNEVEYEVTQRLFLRPTRTRACDVGETPTEENDRCGGTRESLMWRLAQKRYFDQTFGGALNPGFRNVLDSTLDFSGVAFLTDPRADSPILSQMRLSATDRLDVEWDINYDTHAGKFTQSNTFLNYHLGNYFGGFSHARLNAPGRFQTNNTTSAVSNFSQVRLLLGYGTPTKSGFSAAVNTGLDLNLHSLQYAVLQASYNWNCCGISVEYRKFELGPVRNEGSYRFNLTLANIGTAGNLRRTERLF